MKTFVSDDSFSSLPHQKLSQFMFSMCLITSDYLENRAKYVNAIIGIMHADDGFRLGSFLKYASSPLWIGG